MSLDSLTMKQRCWIAVVVAAVFSTGCQTFAPGRFAGIPLPGEDQRIAKQAQNDPFPSPADVGIEQPQSD